MSHVAEQLLGQLLGDGRTTARTLLPEDASLDDGSQQGLEIDAGMLIETCVLSSYQRVDQRLRQLRIVDHDTILAAETIGAHQLSIGRIDLRCKAVNGVL